MNKKSLTLVMTMYSHTNKFVRPHTLDWGWFTTNNKQFLPYENSFIIGRKTWETTSIQSIVKNNNLGIVLTNDSIQEQNKNVMSSPNIEYALRVANATSDNVYILGGMSIFDQTFNICDKLIVRRILTNKHIKLVVPGFSKSSETEIKNENGFVYQIIHLNKISSKKKF